MITDLLQAGWLDDLTRWILRQIRRFVEFLLEVIADAGIWLLDAVFEVAFQIIDAIPVPAFLENNSLDAILGSAGPTVGWIMTTFQIPQGLAIIGAAYAFRLLRKVVTLFQW